MLRALSKTVQMYAARKMSLSTTNNKEFIVNSHEEFVTKVMESDRSVIVNFHAEWCEPCKILTPKLSELLGPLVDIDLAIIDVECHADLVHTFEVKAVPAVLAIKDGHVLGKFIGLVEAHMIEDLINKLKPK